MPIATATVTEEEANTILDQIVFTSPIPPELLAKGVDRPPLYDYDNGVLSISSTEITQAALDALVALLPPAPVVTPASLAIDKATAEINEAFAESFKTMIAGYPHEETETWIYQSDEAWDVVNGKNRPTPILDAIASQTGESIATLAQSIVDKEAQYKLAIGNIVGKRHALINTLNAIDTTLPAAGAAIAAVVW